MLGQQIQPCTVAKVMFFVQGTAGHHVRAILAQPVWRSVWPILRTRRRIAGRAFARFTDEPLTIVNRRGTSVLESAQDFFDTPLDGMLRKNQKCTL